MKIQNILILILLLLFSNCKKNNNNKNPIPNIAFDITINIDLPSYNNLFGVGGWICIDGGAKGIIIYRKSVDVFVAFDRQSPKDLNGDCVEPLTPDSINFLQLNDYCSNAKFSMYDGAAIMNSEFGLRQYQTNWNGTNILRIYN
jgi:hypothetical protein